MLTDTAIRNAKTNLVRLKDDFMADVFALYDAQTV